MARRTTAKRELHELVLQFTPRIRGQFLDAIQDIKDNAILAELTRAIRDGDVMRALHHLNLSDARFNAMIREIETAFERGGVAVQRTFPRNLKTGVGSTVFRFDVRDSRAEAWLRDRSSRMVREIGQETRAAVRNAVQRGMADGRNPRDTALDLVGRIDRASGRRTGGVVGLTRNQEGWVANARRDLEQLDLRYLTRARRDKRFDGIVQKAIAEGKPLDADTINKLVGRYEDSLLKYRGDVIGRTESIAALNRSEWEAYNQAVAEGALTEDQIERVWQSSGHDGRTRDSHLQMDGQKVGLNESFEFPGGDSAMFPGDTSLDAPPEETIQCRCIAETRVNWFARAREVVTEDERAAILAMSDEELFGGR